MNTQQKLTKHLITYIFSNLGIVTGSLWGTAGITEDIFKTSKVIKIQYDDDIFQFPIYAAQCNVGEDKINVLALKIDDEDYTEFALVFRMNENPIFGLKQLVESDDPGTFVISNGENWINAGMYEKLVFCAGLEKITDQGIGWSPGNLDLFKFLLQIIEM